MSLLIQYTRSTLKALRLSGFVIAPLVAACGGGNTVDTTKAAQAVWPTRDNTFAHCMAIAARKAYSPLADVENIICDSLLVDPFEHMPAHGTDVLRVFKRRVGDDKQEHVDVLFVFTGTRTPDVGDIARDLESQVLTDYTNHLSPERDDAAMLSGDEKTSKGFDSRWRNHADGVRKALEAIDEESVLLGQTPATTIAVIGHSLGAATATRAAFDINRSIKNQRVVLWSFNSPHVGNSSFANAYIQSLKTCGTIQSGCFMVRQFTRSGDPIHKLPLLLSHPVWNPSQAPDTRKNTGDPVEVALDYCTHYHAPSASTLNLPQNHKLDRWRMDIYDIPAEHFNCMFKY